MALLYGPPLAFHLFKHSVKVDQDHCTGCLRCKDACNAYVFGVEEIDGVKKACVANPDKCMGCMMCITNCPVKAIQTVVERKTKLNRFMDD